MKSAAIFLVPLLMASAFLLNACGEGHSAPPPPPATQFSVSPSAGTTNAGTPLGFTVTALGAGGAVATGYSGTVHFTSSDSQAVLPADSTLTNGIGMFSATFKTAGTQNLQAADKAVGTIVGSATVSVNAGPAAQLTVVFSVAAASAGVSFGITVTALDSFMNLATSYTGTVHFTSSDPKATLPADAQLPGGNAGFSGVTFNTIGSQTITATDKATASLTGTTSQIKVVSNAATHLVLNNLPGAVTTRLTLSFNVSALDAIKNVSLSYAGTVHFSSSDSKAVLPANATLTAGNSSSLSVTFETAATQTLAATDISSSNISGSSNIQVTVATAPAFSSGAPPSGTVGVNYGPSSLQYELCRISFVFGFQIVCTPCTPGSGGTCASYPRCNPVARRYPCIEVNSAFDGFTLKASGGVPPYSWSASGMPPGLSVNAANGDLLGTPTSPGTFSATFTVTDSGLPPVSTNANFPITIAPPAAPVVNATPPPPPGVVGLPYNFTFTASGFQPLTWSETGMLPNGLTLDGNTGAFTGMPTVANSFPIIVTATDSFSQSSTGANFTIVISTHGFQTVGNMIAPRTLHTATLLGSGKVLIAGGETDPNTLLATAELLDPGTGTSAPTGNMQTSRSQHTATLLNDGRVLIAGGGSGTLGDAVSTAELYDANGVASTPTTGNMQVARFDHTATLLDDGTVLLVGGADATGTALASAEIFNPATGTFAATGGMHTPRKGHTATLLTSGSEMGKVFVTGGIDANSNHVNTAELYDPAAKTFTTVTGLMTVTRSNHTATLLTSGPDAGKVLVAGGVDDTGTARNTADLFDPSAQSFTATTAMVSAHSYHTATLLNDGTVLIVGGADATGNATAVVELFDPAAGNFTVTGSLVTAREQHTASLLANGKVLVVGGIDASGNALASAETYQ